MFKNYGMILKNTLAYALAGMNTGICIQLGTTVQFGVRLLGPQSLAHCVLDQGQIGF